MKIRSISCTQFGGIRDRNLTLGDGLTLIYGKNESGKSTLVNLLGRTLFQSVNINLKTDREFKERYFPGAKRGSAVAGDFIDGTLALQTPEGTYVLTKEWAGKTGKCTLRTPEGAMLRDQERINQVLGEILVYGEGIYGDYILASQTYGDGALRALLDATKKTSAKGELGEVVAQAFAESDGISAEAIAQAIEEKIKEIAGDHWDLERCVPTRKTGAGRWQKGLGRILEAYYAREDAGLVLGEIQRLEQAVEAAAADYEVRKEQEDSVQKALEQFRGFVGLLKERKRLQEDEIRLRMEGKKYQEVLLAWPQAAEAQRKAQALEKEREGRKILDLFEKVRAVEQRIRQLMDQWGGSLCPTNQERVDVKNFQKRIQQLENQMRGMNLRAVIQMLGDHRVVITSVLDGRKLELSQESLTLREAVRITVDGVMELELSPADVNLEETRATVEQLREQIRRILEKYGVRTLEDLEQLAEDFKQAKQEKNALVMQRDTMLGLESYEQLESRAAAVEGEVRLGQVIDREIQALCKGRDIGRFAAELGAEIRTYERDYSSPEMLKQKLEEIRERREKVEQALEALGQIPPEYARIPDPEAHGRAMAEQCRQARQQMEASRDWKIRAIAQLDRLKEDLKSDPREELDLRQREFQRISAELDRWRHMKQVLQELRANICNNPMKDLAQSFARYLGMITGGQVCPEFPHGEKLDVELYSHNTLVDYGKLSEGTKETVALAFRLAVLDQLFPQGGVLVLDDPLTDMDPERTAQACRLIQECARHHQVIFLTCKEEYRHLLEATEIEL